MRDLKDYSLKAHNTFGIEAKCSRFLEFENENDVGVPYSATYQCEPETQGGE